MIVYKNMVSLVCYTDILNLSSNKAISTHAVSEHPRDQLQRTARENVEDLELFGS